MGTSALVSVEEYLHSSYSPDREFVEGQLLERNVGERDHSRLQRVLINYFQRYEQRGLAAWPEQRVQVKERRFRIPDVCVTLGEPEEQIFASPPLICIEILSAEDTMRRIHEKVRDYLEFGVPYVWVLNPRNRDVLIGTEDGFVTVTSGELSTEPPHPEVRIDLAELFSL